MVLQNRQFTLFVELLQISLGVKHEFVVAPSEEEWRELARM